MAWTQPLPFQRQQLSPGRVNSVVRREDTRHLLWSTDLYGTPRRRYDFGIFKPSKNMRMPHSRRNPTLLTVESLRVLEAKDPLTLGHLSYIETTEVRAKEKFKQGGKAEEIMNGEKEEEKEEEHEEEEEEEEEEKEEGEEEEAEYEEKEKEEEGSKEVGEEEKEENKEEQRGLGEDNKEKGEKAICYLLEETEGQDKKKRRASSNDVQRAASRIFDTKAEMISVRQIYGPQMGNQHSQDLPQYTVVTALGYPRMASHGFSCPSSQSPDSDHATLGQACKFALGYPEPVSASGSALRETFPEKERELTGRPGSADSREAPKEKLGGSPQATVPGSPATPASALKTTHKRKAATLELVLPPTGPLPLPVLLQLLWEQGDLPPPPKIPRIGTEKESDTIKNVKGQAIHISDDKVDALQPKTQVIPVHTAPQPILPGPPPPASGPAGSLSMSTDEVSSPVPPASTPLLCQTAGPQIPSVPPVPSFTPSIPTIPVCPPAIPPDSLPPCRTRPCVQSPPYAKKDGTDLPQTLASATFHLPRPGPEHLSFNSPSCNRESSAPMCIASQPPLSFPATSPAPSLGNPPTVCPTTASPACEDMSWEPSGPAVMDMDTTPPSEASILSSPTVSSGSSFPFAPSYGCVQQRVAAFRVPCHSPFRNNLYTPRTVDGQTQEVFPAVWIQPGLVPASPPMVTITPPYAARDFEFMDTTPPSKALILHSSPASDHVSNTLAPQSVWGPTTACPNSPATPAFMRNPSTSAAAVGPTSVAGQPASGSKRQPRFAGPTSPADRCKRYAAKLPNMKCLCVSDTVAPTSRFTLSPRMGSGDCSSPSTNFTQSRAGLMKPVVPQSGENCWGGMRTEGCVSTPRYHVVRSKAKGSRSTAEPIILKLRRSCPSTHSGAAVKVSAGEH